MIEYSIAALAIQSGRLSRTGSIVMAPISDRLGTRRAYLAELRRLLSGIAQAVNNTVLPIYVYEQRDSLTRDVDENTFARLRAIVAQLTGISSNTVRRILDLESIRHTDTFIDEARKAIGIDVSAVVQQDDLGEYLKTAIARNTSLIRSLSDETVKRVEQAVVKNSLEGNSAKTLRGVLTGEFGVMDSRAKLIARDQTSKFNSDLNRIRQEQAGVEAYNWSTAHDERVRPLHKGLDGNRYDWGKPTGAEDGLPPGQPIQCRCIARAVIEWEGMPAAKPATVEFPPALPVTPRDFVKPPKRTLDQVYAEVPTLQKRLDEVATVVDGAYKTPGFKEYETAAEKIGRKGYEHAGQLTDIIRGGYVVNTPKHADRIIKKLSKSFDVLDEGWKTTEAGYFDRKALVRFENGMVGEIQFWEKNVLTAKKGSGGGGHELYKKARALPAGSPEREALEAQQRVLYMNARAKAGPSWAKIEEGAEPVMLLRKRRRR